MMRSAVVILCVFCMATLIAEALGLAFLWYRGQLTAETLKDIRLVLTGQDQDEFDANDDSAKVQPSSDDIIRNRSMKILELNTREEELSVLKVMITEKANGLIAQQDLFRKKKEAFEQQLQQLNADISSEATEQARGILLALQPADSVNSLMQLSLDENIVLLKGMQEKSIAKILQEFLKGDDEQIERGQKIFEAISLGEPSKTLVQQTTEKLTEGTPRGMKEF